MIQSSDFHIIVFCILVVKRLSCLELAQRITIELNKLSERGVNSKKMTDNEPNPNSPLVHSWRGVYPLESFPNVFAIGLGGLAKCGKTTVGAEVMARIKRDGARPPTMRGSFSARMKQVTAVMVDQESSLNDQDDKQAQLYGGSDWTVRDFLLAFGTGLVREQIGSDFWVDIVAKQMTELTEPTILVFDDMRFPNEVGLIKPLGVAIIIERPGVEKTFIHSSENPESLGIEAIVINDSTPEAAADKVLAIARDHDRWPASR